MPYYRTYVLLERQELHLNDIKARSSYILGLWQYFGHSSVSQAGEEIMTATANQQRFEAIQGVVERLTSHSPESGYSVAR